MDTTAPPSPADLAAQLPRATYWLVMHTLRSLLPPPPTDLPEDLIRRDNAAIAHVAALHPANADEADLAARCVAYSAQGQDCLRQAQRYREDLTVYLKCTAQAASMERRAQSGRNQLSRIQAERRARDADPRAESQAAWIEHCAIGLMTEAAGHGRAAPEPAPPPPPPPPDPEDKFRALTEAERYAALYPRRAALIRAHGGMPPKPGFDPLLPELVDAIVRGTSPLLVSLDDKTSLCMNIETPKRQLPGSYPGAGPTIDGKPAVSIVPPTQMTEFSASTTNSPRERPSSSQ